MKKEDRKSSLSPPLPKTPGQGAILFLGALSLLFFTLVRLIPLKKGNVMHEEMVRASKIMAGATDILRECGKERGVVPGTESDVNQTGLIGLEFSPLTTSLGSLEAKRTTTNPNFGGLVVFLLHEAGVRRGETIAVGASSSFPALIVATLSAAKAMEVRVVMICSLGASHWGANNPDFHWLHMQDCLVEAGIFQIKAVALSVGGARDRGEDMRPEGRSFVMKEIQESGVVFIQESGLRENVESRIALYEEKAGEAGIKAFVNIGGSWPNMGEDAGVLQLKPGLVKVKKIPLLKRRGVIYEMAAREIPVIHLLYIRGLVQRYGLAWDPVPLPRPGEGEIYDRARVKQRSFLYLAALYFLCVGLVLVFLYRPGRK